jgi:hypothetical protein
MPLIRVSRSNFFTAEDAEIAEKVFFVFKGISLCPLR